ncbi:MAG TPA: hypothetical protein VJ975_10280 [Candidatus Limnocylindria bacterium]|nr:hypothetical protein [Candidatus Limnocylindria bacterium]
MPVRGIPAGVTTARLFRTAVAIGCAAWLVLTSVGSVAATTSLPNRLVTPNPATVGSPVTFSVDYSSVPPQPKDAASVEAVLVRASDQTNITVPLTRQGGSLRSATWTGSSTVPIGTWQVTFRATDIDGVLTTADADAALIVNAPPPSPTPTSTTAPTPTATGTPTPVPTPLTPGMTPAPTVRPTTAARAPSPVPTAPPSATASASAVATASPVPSATASNQETSETPDVSPSVGQSDELEPQAAQVDADAGSSLVPWLVLGGGMATTGATILVAQAVVVRRRRR